MEEIWIEKYRPSNLSEVVGQTPITSRLKNYVKERSMPHLLFAGPAGTGKTTCALALARELFGELWKHNLHELNASDERGIDVVRGKIKEFARTAPLGEDGFKIIFLDEADALTGAAQAALRRTMEKYSRTCRFVMSCNFSSKIIDPIQSRCAVFRFRPLKAEDVERYLKFVAVKEELNIDKEAYESLTYLAQGDLRRAINGLQMAAAANVDITPDVVYQAVAAARPEEVKEALEMSLNNNFAGARERLDTLQITYGLAGEDVLRQMHRSVRDIEVPDTIKVQMIEKLAEADFRLSEGANARIQIEAVIANFAVLGRHISEP
ncbi:MAG: replication factor C small subunit [Candidatus Poseidoniia archaeon]|jgi:replication factor C small subunit|nr:replication factor C small subunit [Candidatus Poseidoniia archaeon]MDP6441641.1 replication factor C small subunit [Candidatus Poseidoniia archaeon]MDP6592100.1 replication factor C small subunit [Candidatus Poseidoniia archaeon]MDP7096416.1 replication factor C small subunit [Candidatus Poseidoniia archaeon]MDP7187623.1 replication factor C small subunit [Candidatus Poseidoniia archaeon]|tara:strand:- start:6612 stop:7577 length:966 start_codon:yes stop_codon:yes gene_type:complete